MKFYTFLAIVFFVSALTRADDDAIDKPTVDDVPTDAIDKPDADDTTHKPNDDDVPIEDPVAADDKNKDFNKKLDEILAETIQKLKEKISPYKLEDRKITFQKKISGVNVTGAIGFENITIHGLENIKREGNSYLAKTRYGNTEMRVRLAVGPLSLKADGLVSFLGMSSSSSYEFSLRNVAGSAVLHFYPKTEEIYVKSFNMGQLRGLRFRITKSPLYFTPMVVNQVSRATFALYRPLINAAVAQTAPRVLKSAVKDSQFLKDIMTKYADN